MEDAQAMEAEHHKSELAAKSARAQSPDDTLDSPVSEQADVVGPLDNRTRELREELLQRAEELKSFNHDVDWEQRGNPNLKTTRKLTEDARVTGNPQHKEDIEGHGHDHMADATEEGYGVGRDSVLIKGSKEVLVADLDPEGKATLEHPRRHGESLRLPSYVVKLEMPNPPLPPRPGMDRMNTEQLGLPMLSQLPALPQEDDSDIGGPPLVKMETRHSVRDHHPLMSEMRKPLVDRDCMMDPVHDAFLYDTWHAVAENNTKIYRSVFRCMPDNQVRSWDDYHQYVAYEHRFDELQGNDVPGEEKVTHPARAGSVSKSGPPGAGSRTTANLQIKALTEVPGDVDKRSSDLKDKVMGVFGDNMKSEQEVEKEKLRKWAADTNQAQADRLEMPSLHRQETLSEEKAGLPMPTLHEDQVVNEDGSGEGEEDSVNNDLGHVSTSTATAVEKDKSPTTSGSFVGYSNAMNENSAQAAATSSAAAGSTRRRRRGTTRSSRRDFNASDDMLSIEEAEELLGCVQGHLVIWPYDW
jgi:phospholipase D1/2